MTLKDGRLACKLESGNLVVLGAGAQHVRGQDEDWLYRRQGTHGKRCTNTLRDTNTDNLHDARQNARTHLKEVASDAIDCVINGQHMDALAVLDVGAREHLHDITKAHAQILAYNLPTGIDSQK